jgi:thiol-disulfide isomerase/thioredoxin
MKKQHLLFLFITLLSLSLLIGCASNTVPAQDSTVPESTPSVPQSTAGETTKPAPENTVEERPLVGNRLIADFTTTDLYGNAVDQSLFEGYDVIMLNFWGTFCGPCIKEMPDLGELSAEYADKNVLIVGVVTDLLNAKGEIDEKVLEDGKYIAETTGATYTHLVPCEGLLPLMQQIYAVPTTVFLNAEGYQLGAAQTRALDKASWSLLLDELLEQLEAAA